MSDENAEEIERLQDIIARLTRERDEARAEAAALRKPILDALFEDSADLI